MTVEVQNGAVRASAEAAPPASAPARIAERGEIVHVPFFCYPRKRHIDDFREVARRINHRHPRTIRASVHSTKAWLGTSLALPLLARHPTLSIEMDRLRPFGLLRGERLRHRGFEFGKVEEFGLLAAAGIRVPKWVELTPGTKLDPGEWGPYIVVKPVIGARGAFITVQKTTKARYRAPEELEPGHFGRKAGMIAQEFIYTGKQPVNYRVLSYLGEPLVSYRNEARQVHDLPSRFAFKQVGGQNIVAAAKGGAIIPDADPEILKAAREVHMRAFPEVPSLGVDLVRDAETGLIYVMEANPHGASWALTKGVGPRMMREFNIDFYAQFDALEVIVRASAEAALKLAR